MTTTVDYETAPTADLSPAALAEIRAALDEAYGEGQFADEDWQHCLGGIHVVACADGRVVGHGSVVARRLSVGGRAYSVGYVEGLAVLPRWRRRGIASRIMSDLEAVIRAGFEFGALSTTEDAQPLYERRGWLLWRGPLFAQAPSGGTVPTPDDEGGIYVLPAVDLDLDAPLTCDWRAGDVW